jgi:alkylation response protein AidB-like acyl-CoA dehydrogenase
MHFGFTKEQEDIREAAESFAEGEFDLDSATEWDTEHKFPIDIWQKACELGFIGMHIPEHYGGQGLGQFENTLAIEAFCRKDSGVGLALALSDLGATIISQFGTEEQAQSYLPSICKGEMIPSLAYLEKIPLKSPGLFETTVTKKKDAYVINGQKTFVYNVTFPGPMILLCQALKDKWTNSAGCFIIRKDMNRLAYEMSNNRVGMRMIPIGNLTFSDYRIPLTSSLDNGRVDATQWGFSIHEMNLKASAAATGIAQGAFDMALTYAHQRKQFGRKIASFEAIQGKLVDMKTRVDISRLLTYKAAWDMDSNGGNTVSAAMAKKVATETALAVTREAIHIFGGYGYIVDYHIERFYRDAGMIDIIGLPGYTHENLLSDQIVGKMKHNE